VHVTVAPTQVPKVQVSDDVQGLPSSHDPAAAVWPQLVPLQLSVVQLLLSLQFVVIRKRRNCALSSAVA
jgi:hypothetical protein